jgi:hypothetical protein
MKTTITIKKTWSGVMKGTEMTYPQYEFIMNLMNDENMVGWDFPSASQARKQIDKYDASEIIDTLKKGGSVEIV